MIAYRIWKPGRAILWSFWWDLMVIAPGIFVLVWYWQSPWMIVAGVMMCLLGCWRLLCSIFVARTHFITTEHEVILVGTFGSLSLPWDKVTQATIRERPRGMKPGRADRVVLLADGRRNRLVLNTSVLDESEEALLLQEIRRKVTCPINLLQDGPLNFPRRS